MSDPLIALFADILEVDASSLNDESSPDTVDQWDSLAAMHLVAGIEETFNTQLSTKEIMKMSSIGLARAALKDKGLDV
jgi:acyl carrier protein